MKKNTQQAFILFYTILIVGAILSSTSIMLSIYIKNLKLGGIARESVIAYSAAETGAECALYWHLNGAVFDSGIDVKGLEKDPVLPDTYNQIPAECNGTQISTNGSGEFTVNYGGGSEPCAVVTVTTAAPVTTIRSRGYNVCDISAAQVERGYEIRI